MADQPKRIGALWLKTASNGKKFFAGSITVNGIVQSIVIFKNLSKKQENHPDYEILPGRERTA